MAAKPHIFIATPTSGGIMKAAYVTSLAGLMERLHASGITTTYANIDASHIAEQRDALAHLALQSKATHVLFIDSDMKFPASLAEVLLAFGQPFVGAIYPRRTLDFDKVEAALAQGKAFAQAMAAGYEFLVKIDAEKPRPDGFCRVQHLGFGFVLLAREVFETMTKRLKLPRYPGRYVKGELAGYFQEMAAGNGRLISEDLSFCQRWRECGGEVWGHASSDIKHVGDFAYGVPFETLFGRAQT